VGAAKKRPRRAVLRAPLCTGFNCCTEAGILRFEANFPISGNDLLVLAWVAGGGVGDPIAFRCARLCIIWRIAARLTVERRMRCRPLEAVVVA
jgi:hypothetical protein